MTCNKSVRTPNGWLDSAPFKPQIPRASCRCHSSCSFEDLQGSLRGHRRRWFPLRKPSPRCYGRLEGAEMRSRRNFLKMSAAGLSALGTEIWPPLAIAARLDDRGDRSASFPSRQGSPISVWCTDEKQRFTRGNDIRWQAAPGFDPATGVRVVSSNRFQEILGFGGCFSDASCYLISQLKEPERSRLLHELFHPSEMGLNCNRTCVGAADSAASLYSYDEGDPDPELKRFSVDHDRTYILPVLRQVSELNPDMFFFSSPWSPPGWMKWNKSMLGGSMSRQYLASYAQYLLKFVQAYAAEGVRIQAITIQNEIDTDQHGQMPACTWSQECETEFVIEHLGPLFA